MVITTMIPEKEREDFSLGGEIRVLNDMNML